MKLLNNKFKMIEVLTKVKMKIKKKNTEIRKITY